MSGAGIQGRCLCGAVRVRAALGREISACFCDNCRRWGGGLQMGIEVPESQVAIEGPVKVHRSTTIAERAWCDVCGSALWLRSVEGPDVGTLELSPGLFDEAGGARLVRVVYADRAPAGYDLAGDPRRVSRADYERDHPFVEDAE